MGIVAIPENVRTRVAAHCRGAPLDGRRGPAAPSRRPGTIARSHTCSPGLTGSLVRRGPTPLSWGIPRPEACPTDGRVPLRTARALAAGPARRRARRLRPRARDRRSGRRDERPGRAAGRSRADPPRARLRPAAAGPARPLRRAAAPGRFRPLLDVPPAGLPADRRAPAGHAVPRRRRHAHQPGDRPAARDLLGRAPGRRRRRLRHRPGLRRPVDAGLLDGHHAHPAVLARPSSFCRPPATAGSNVIMPAFVLGVHGAAYQTRLLRSAMLDVHEPGLPADRPRQGPAASRPSSSGTPCATP